jgi:hypothetical protein
VRLERTTFGFGGQGHQNVSGDKTKTCDCHKNCSAVYSDKFLQKHPELAEIIAAWPSLPDHIKQAIKSLIQTNGSDPQ